MSSNQAKKLIVISAIMTFTLGLISYLKNGQAGGAPIIGFLIPVGFVYFALSAISDFQPGIAGPMALLIMTTSIFLNGLPFLEFVGNLNPFTPKSSLRHKKGDKHK
jgi:hypothetical protein